MKSVREAPASAVFIRLCSGPDSENNGEQVEEAWGEVLNYQNIVSYLVQSIVINFIVQCPVLNSSIQPYQQLLYSCILMLNHFITSS